MKENNINKRTWVGGKGRDKRTDGRRNNSRCRQVYKRSGAPLRRPEVRNAVIAAKEKNEMLIDRITIDTVKEAQFDYKVQESAKKKPNLFGRL